MDTNLTKLLDAFRKVLADADHSIQQLLKLEEKKYDALKQVSVKELMSINSVEEEIVQLVDALEKKRQDILVQLSDVLHVRPGIQLQELIMYLPDRYQGEFQVLRDSIRHKTDRLDITMRENAALIQTNLDIMNFTMNFATRAAQQETYNYRDKKESKENVNIINQIA